MPKKLDRNTERVHLTLYSDSVAKAQRMFPNLTLSDIVRQILDKALEKADQIAERQKKIAAETANDN
jgi:hypothetical protein